ncbi:unnamed protein product [Miscanthus lutarioriparius]|uniref:Uncharacterized protein n=1 Tax=Miscanthus lutarioriparius TaxID=422564 RepID=A0A811N875_9POAL|nr:unnamed protein product [Miscanthus lutarioriparius]
MKPDFSVQQGEHLREIIIAFVLFSHTIILFRTTCKKLSEPQHTLLYAVCRSRRAGRHAIDGRCPRRAHRRQRRLQRQEIITAASAARPDVPAAVPGPHQPDAAAGQRAPRAGLAVTVLHTRLNALDPARRHPEFQFVPVLDGVPAHVAASGNVIDIIEAMNAAMEADGAAALRAVLESVVADEARPLPRALSSTPTSSPCPGLLRPSGSGRWCCAPPARPASDASWRTPCFTKRAIFLLKSKLYMPVKELPPLRVRDLFYSSWSNHKKMRELLARANEAMKNSSGLVINTLDALEKAELKRLCEELHIPVVLAPGPLHKLSSKRTRSSTPDQDYSCIEWLDKQPSESVLYVSFGSLASLDAKEFLEVAWGLANSGHPFLWVVRADSVRGFLDGPDIPNGFEAAVHGRGKVIRWAPQQEVLAHPAVGGFWTHSGWNSTLESISEGVPMICRPQFADQMMNTRYVVNTWGVGLELEGELERGKIEKAVRKLMKDREGEEMRERAKELKKNVADCLKAGGTSQVAIDKLVDYILSM